MSSLPELTEQSTFEDFVEYLKRVRAGLKFVKDPLVRATKRMESEAIITKCKFPKEYLKLVAAAYAPVKSKLLENFKSPVSSSLNQQEISSTPHTKIKGWDEKIGGGGSGDIDSDLSLPDSHSNKPITMSELKAEFNSHMLWVDPDAFDIAFAVVAAHDSDNTPPWLWMVGPPSSGKTELVTLFNQLPKVYTISEVTRKTFFSGLSVEDAVNGEDPSLMMKLTDNILTFKDLTTLLSLRTDDRNEIFGQLREIFDGQYKKTFGTGQVVDWTGKISFLAGVTSVIDHHHKVMAQLGPRFLLLRLKHPPGEQSAKVARLRPDGKWRKELQARVAKYFRHLPQQSYEVSEEYGQILDFLATLISTGRSIAYRDGDGDMTEIPEAEQPARIVQQFDALLKGLARIDYRNKVNDDDIRKLVRSGLDTLPPGRRLVLEKLARHPNTTNDQIRKGTNYSNFLIGNNLEELHGLGLVDSDSETFGAKKWKLSEWGTKLFSVLLPHMPPKGD